jgi:2-phosphoglycerate kinase
MMPAMPPVDEGLSFQFLRLNLDWAQNLAAIRAASDEDRAARLDEQAALVAALDELSGHDTIPFFALARRAALTPLESQIVGVLLAQAFDEVRAEPLTPAAVADLFLDGSPEARVQALALLSTESNLRTAGILEPPTPSWRGLLQTPLRLTPACLALLSGQVLDTGDYRFVPAQPPRRAVVPEAQAEQMYNAVASQAAILQRGGRGDAASILLLLWGPDGTGKATFARELAGQFFAGLVELDGARLAAATRETIRDAVACAVLHGALLLIEHGEDLRRVPDHVHALLEALRATPACVAVTSTERDLGGALEGAWSLVSRFAPPTPQLRGELWRSHLPTAVPLTADVDLDALAERYPLSGAAIARAARLAAAYSAADPEPAITAQLLDQAAAAQLDDDLGDHVRTLRPAHALDDLIVPAATRRQLDELLAAYRSWDRVVGRWGTRLATGQSLAVLLHGEAGTGKTFAAEVIASALGQPLHVVEAGADLRAVFARARERRAILLFDDAAALLVRPSVLLHELDRHVGCVLLTAHVAGPLSPALRTRLLFSIEMPALDADARLALWQRLVPPAAELDLAALATTFALSGGELKNAALRAALAASAEGGPITQRLLLEACEQIHRLQRTGSTAE